MPDVASALLKHLTALLILRCVVGGVSAIDNDAWKFSDTQSRSMQKPELMKKPSKWGIVSKAVNSSSAVEDTMREAIAAVHISRNKPMAGSLAAGSQALVDVEIAQDPAVVVVRAVALLLNRCETVRIELAQSLPNRFGVGMPRHLLRPMSGDLDSLESEFLSHDMGLDSSVLLPAAHRSLALLGGRHANATVASLHSSLDSLIAAGMPITMIFNLLATVHRLVETKEAGLLRKLILLSGRPKSLNGPEGENTGADLTETYCTQPLQFNGSASRNGLSLEKFYHDGVAVSFLMLLYTLQRWVNIDAVAKSVVWDLLSEFGLLRVFDFFDYVEDFESLGEESSEEGSRYRIPEVGSMCAEAQLDLYALLIVYIRLVTDSPTDSRASVGYGRKRTDVRSNGSDLVARQRREPSAPESLDSDGSIVIDWSPQQSLSSAVEELRKRVGGGMLVSHLKSALLLGTSTDTRDRYVSVSRAERVQQRGRAVRERKTRSPYSHSRSRSRSFSPSRASHESYGAMFAACKTQTITSITTSFSVGLQDADDEALEVTEPVTVQEASGRSYEPSFQELLNAAMRGANLTDLKVKNSIIINSTRSNNSGKHGNERPSSRATCQSGSRGSSANGTRHSKPVDGPPTRLSKRQQDDLRARLADIRRPKSSTRSPINDHDPSVPSVVPIGALRRVHEGTAEPRVRTVGVAFDDEGDRDPSQPGKLVVPRIVVPTPPSSARGSFVPLAMPAESPVNPRHKSLQYVARRRHFRARDSPRAYTTQMTMRSTGEAGCALSLADGRGQSTEVMQELQAMLFDRLVDQDDFD